MLNTINFDAAIKANALTFEQACALSRFDTIDDAIKADALTFEQAVKLANMAAPNSATPAPKKATKATKAKAPAKAEETKAEVPENADEWTYTKGGAIIQYGAKNTLKANHLRRVNNAMKRLVDAGFCVSWKRVGCWVYIYHDRKADKKTSKEYASVKLPAGWEMRKGAWVDDTMLKGYEDSFRAEK